MVELLENVRGRDVFVLQSTCAPTNDNLMEILVMVDALKRASAGAHHRGDPVLRLRAAGPASALGARARSPRRSSPTCSTTVGVNRVMTMDLHADQIQGFFNIPVDNIYATPILLGDLWKQNYENLLVVSPDVGGVVRARAIAKRLDSDLAIIDKRRPKANVAEVMNIIGDVEGRTCVIMDDIVDTANTLCKAATALEGERRAEGRRLLHAPGALRAARSARIAESELDEIGRHRHDSAVRRGARAARASAQLSVRAAARRDDDAHLQRGVGQLAVHRVARVACQPRCRVCAGCDIMSSCEGSRFQL